MARSFTILSAAVFLVVAGSVAHAATDPADACKNTKAKAAGKKAADLMKALGKNCKKPDTAKLAKAISKAQSKLTKQFVKAEGKGGCLTTADVGAIEAKVDALAFDIAGDVNPPDTTTTTGATTTTTSTTAGATTTTTAGATTTTTAGATTTTTSAPTTTTTVTTTTTSTTMPPPPPTCSPASPYPACDGTCPPGFVCQDAAFPGPPAGFCDCTPTATLCGDPPGGAPACYGDCPMPGDVCKFDGVGTCTCEPEFPPCGPGTLWPICDGICPPGMVCADTLASGVCGCELPPSPCGVFPDGPPECWGDCPPGEICIYDGAVMCECIPF